MVISDAEKKILLERLEKARIAKQAKAAEKKAADAKKAPAPAPAPAPVPEPEPLPEPEPVVVEEKHAPAGAPTPLENPPASTPIDIPPVPDLVSASKRPAKKVSLPDSDSEEEPVMPKKKKVEKKKDVPYMKIKLYKEPSNPEAFQQLLEAVNDQGGYEDEEQEAPPPPIIKGPRVLQKVGVAPKRGAPSSLTPEDVKAAELRRLALEIFG